MSGSKGQQESAAGVCPRCKGSKWILYKRKASDVAPFYEGRDIWLDFAKRCPDCTSEKEDMWSKAYSMDVKWEDLN